VCVCVCVCERERERERESERERERDGDRESKAVERTICSAFLRCGSGTAGALLRCQEGGGMCALVVETNPQAT